MTVVVTRDVAPRITGFLKSVLLEIAPGVFTSPRMSAGVRERVWSVISEWFNVTDGGSVLMTWVDTRTRGGQQVRVLGEPAKELIELDGVFVTRREPLQEKPRRPKPHVR